MGGKESTILMDVEKARTPLPHEIPRSARQFITLADRLGWKNESTFARGYPLQKTGKESETIVDSLVLKLRAPVRNHLIVRGVIYWENNSVYCTWYLPPDGSGWHKINTTQLKKLMQELDHHRSFDVR